MKDVNEIRVKDIGKEKQKQKQSSWQFANFPSALTTYLNMLLFINDNTISKLPSAK